MKRPDMVTIYGPVQASAKDVAQGLLALLLDDLKGYLSTYHARMKFDPEKKNFFFWDEEMGLPDREELLKRVEADRGGRWYCNVNLGFFPAEVRPALFADPPDSPHVTLLTAINSGMTKFLEEAERPRVPFVSFLIRTARAIGSGWFLSGVDLDQWRAVPLERIMTAPLPPRTYVVGWKHGIVDEAALLAGLGLGADQVKRSTYGYRFITFFPPP